MPLLMRLLGVALLVATAGASSAQTPPAAPPPTAPPALSRADLELVVTLLRNTLIALHQANTTGNYTVLRDLASPGFRANNTAARLGEIFATVRERQIDLGRVVLLDPQISAARINAEGMLYLAGSLATQPDPVRFELLYEAVDGAWLVFGISIAPDTGQQPGAPPSAPAAGGVTPPGPGTPSTPIATPPTPAGVAPAPTTPVAPAATPVAPGSVPVPPPRP